jgi:excisionase family DNA binding protein
MLPTMEHWRTPLRRCQPICKAGRQHTTATAAGSYRPNSSRTWSSRYPDIDANCARKVDEYRPRSRTLINFLADRVKARHDVLMLDPWCAGSDPPAMPRRLLITKSDAAEQLGVSLRTIERLISSGRLPLVHVEGAARVRVTDLEAYVQGLEADCAPKSSPT